MGGKVGGKWNGKYEPEICLMLAVSLAFGWPRPAFPASQIAPGGPMTPPLSARPNTADKGTGDSPPDGATDRRALADNPDYAANSEDSGKNAQPVRLKLTQMADASLAAMLADGPDGKASGHAKKTAPAAPDYVANSDDRAGNAQTVHLKLAQMVETSLVTELADGPNENPPVRVEETAPAGSAVETAAAAPAGERRFSLQFPPIRTWGNIGYDLRSESFGEIKYLSQSIVTKVNASTNSYIWQPWFAQVSGGLGLSSTRSSTSSSSGSNTTDNKVTSNYITGNAALNLLPYSRFPFEAHFDRSDNRLDTGLSGIDSSYRSTRYGLTQRYRTLTGDTQYMASYDRNLWESAVFGTDQQDLLRLEMTKRLAKQTLQINGDINNTERQKTNESTMLNTLVARHSYIPDPTLSVESLGNLSRTNYRLAQGETDLRYLQLSSSAFWRPAEKPLTVTGSARLFGMNSASSGGTPSALRSASANLGAFYELSKNIRLNGSANVNINDSNGIQTVASNQSAGITYQPDAFDLASFRYNGFASGTVTNRIDSIDSGQHLALQLGHSLNRSMGLGVGALGLNMNQTVSSDFDSSIPTILRLSHSGSLTWSHAEGQNNTFLRLSASDSRAVSGTQDFFQLLNLQASRNEGLTRNASWAGNLTIQMVRQKTGIMPFAYYNTPVATDTTPDTPVTTTTTSSADLSYRHQRAFGVPRLRFVSELRIYGDMPLPVFAGPRLQESRSWENRLDYTIGRLQLRLSARVSEISSSNTSTRQSLLMFSLNRPFGAQ
ncbi:MAG: hypothetical protein ACYCY5_13260 [Sulfuricella sp.]